MTESKILNMNRKMAIAVVGSSGQSVTQDYTIINLTSKLADTFNFTLVSDGGLKCPINGVILTEGLVSVSGLNSTDILQIDIGVYNGGWVTETISARNTGGNVLSVYLGIIPLTINANDNIYLRIRNTSGARGAIVNARLKVEYVN